jgi:hypothetical protein
MSLNGIRDPPSRGAFPPFLRKSPIGTWNIAKELSRPVSDDTDEHIHVKIVAYDPNDSKLAQRFKRRSQYSMDTSPNKIIVDKSKNLLKRFQESDAAQSFSRSKILLHSSFLLSTSSGTETKETKEVACETVSGLLRKKFDSIQEYNIWCKEQVDPFINKLKKAIVSSKPDNLENFVIGFAAREAMGQSHTLLPDMPTTPAPGATRRPGAVTGGTKKAVGFEDSDNVGRLPSFKDSALALRQKNTNRRSSVA